MKKEIITIKSYDMSIAQPLFRWDIFTYRNGIIIAVKHRPRCRRNRGTSNWCCYWLKDWCRCEGVWNIFVLATATHAPSINWSDWSISIWCPVPVFRCSILFGSTNTIPIARSKYCTFVRQKKCTVALPGSTNAISSGLSKSNPPSTEYWIPLIWRRWRRGDAAGSIVPLYKTTK